MNVIGLDDLELVTDEPSVPPHRQTGVVQTISARLTGRPVSRTRVRLGTTGVQPLGSGRR
jgi:hypothetical protein